MGKHHEKRVCIKLGTIQQVAAKKCEVKKNIEKLKKMKQEKKKSEKKVKKVKKIVKKHPKKKVIKKKKKIIKKVLPKKVTPVVKKQEIKKETTTSNTSTKKQNKEPQKTTTQQTTKKKCKKTTPAKKTTQTASAEQQYIKSHIQEIAQLLQENLYYPRRARKRGVEGDVTVSFILKKDAQVSNIKVISSTNEILSRGAVKTLEDLSGEFPRPAEKLHLTVPISYRLNR